MNRREIGMKGICVALICCAAIIGAVLLVRGCGNTKPSESKTRGAGATGNSPIVAEDPKTASGQEHPSDTQSNSPDAPDPADDPGYLPGG
jgi:hypothetical protein